MSKEVHDSCFGIATLIVCYAVMLKVFEWLCLIPGFVELFQKATGF